MRIDLAPMPLADRIRLRYGVRAGAALHVAVHESGGVRWLTVPAFLPHPPTPEGLKIFDLVSMTFALALAAFLGFRIPGMMIAALIVYLGGGDLSWPAFAVFFSGLPDAVYLPLAVLLADVCNWFPVLAVAAFAVRFPQDDGTSAKRTAVRVVDALVLLGFLAGLWLNPGRSVYVACTALSGLIAVAAVASSLRFAKPSDRARVGIVFASIMIGGAGYAANMILRQYGGSFVVFSLYAGLSVVVVPLAVAYAIVRHRVFDIAFVLNRTLVYAITSALVLVALAATEFAAERYLSDLTRVEGIAVEFAIALAIIVSVRIIHARVDRAVDSMLFRARHEEESALRRFATTLQFYTEQAPLLRDTVDVLVRFARVQGAAIYLPSHKALVCAASAYPAPAPHVDENDPAHVQLRAHHERLQIHGFSTAFLGERLYPMFLAGRLTGTISTGGRESGEQMPPDIGEAIERIAAALAVALAAIETDRIRSENALLQARLAGAAI